MKRENKKPDDTQKTPGEAMERVVRVNRHDPKRMYWRKNGVNMGIYIE